MDREGELKIHYWIIGFERHIGVKDFEDSRSICDMPGCQYPVWVVVEWAGDCLVQVCLFLPLSPILAKMATPPLTSDQF